MITCMNSQPFIRGDKVVSLVDNSPFIKIGTVGTVINQWVGPLYAAILPNGQIYKWLAVQDLDPVDPMQPNLRLGDLATVNTKRSNSFSNPFVISGVVVRIIKVIDQIDYYGISVIGGNINNAWLTGLDITNIF